MSAKKDLIDRDDDDDINPFEDDSFVPQVTPGLKPFEPELQDVTLETNRDAPQPAITTGKPSIFSKLSPYFQVDETTLKQKVITALKLGELKSLKDPESQADAQLDLYSTVWITATVIMVLFLSYSGKSVIGSLITNSFSDVTNFQIMINCLLLFYIYVLGMPILAFLICKFVFKEPFDVITAIDTYGVSNIVWVPIGFISVVTGLVGPFENIIEWILVAIGGAYSGGIIYIQLKNVVTELQNGKVLLLAMIAVHILFTLLVRWIIL